MADGESIANSRSFALYGKERYGDELRYSNELNS